MHALLLPKFASRFLSSSKMRKLMQVDHTASPQFVFFSENAAEREPAHHAEVLRTPNIFVRSAAVPEKNTELSFLTARICGLNSLWRRHKYQ